MTRLSFAILLLIGFATSGIAGSERHVARPLEQLGEYRRYSFAASFHGDRAQVSLEMWEGSQEFVGAIETLDRSGKAGAVQLFISGTYLREGDVITFNTGYAGAQVRSRETPDHALVPLGANVPFEVLEASVPLVERRAASTPKKKPPATPRRR